MKVTGIFGGDATKRQVRESVLIQKVPSNDLMNRRDEWRQVKLPRVELRLSQQPASGRVTRPLAPPSDVTATGGPGELAGTVRYDELQLGGNMFHYKVR